MNVAFLSLIFFSFQLFSANVDDKARHLLELVVRVPHHQENDQIQSLVDDFNEVLKIRLPQGQEKCNLTLLKTMDYLNGAGAQALLHDQPYVVAGCSWAAKIVGYRRLEKKFRSTLVSAALEINTTSPTLSETYLNSICGNVYLYPSSFDIPEIFSHYKIGILCGMYLVPVDNANLTFAGLTFEGMALLPLSRFQNEMAAVWQTVIEQQGFGALEPKFDPTRWQDFKNSLVEHGGIEHLAKPETWKLIKQRLIYDGFNCLKLTTEVR